MGKLFHTFRYGIKSMRPKQWIKNVFLFAGLIFSKEFLHPASIVQSLLAFVAFCLLSGSIYLINDLLDREQDRFHPRKSQRPIASGKLGVPAAIAFALFSVAGSLTLSWFLNLQFFLVAVLYFVTMLAYSTMLKHVFLLDVLLIASGFVMRTIGGAVVLSVVISPWLVLCTTFLSLLLALNKRKKELGDLEEDAVSHRRNLGMYTEKLIDQFLAIVVSSTLTAYSLYCFNAGYSYYMMLTIPFVIYGIFRYMYLAETSKDSDVPETLLVRDVPFAINFLLWMITCAVIITV